MGTAIFSALATHVAGAATLALLFFAQDRMLFPAGPYPAGYADDARSRGVMTISYGSNAAPMKAYYIAPADGSASPTSPPGSAAAPDPLPVPRRLWVLFGGNGSPVLLFQGVGAACPDRAAGFLLVDYPGYGECGGQRGVAGTRHAANGAFAALARRMGKDTPAALAKATRLGVAGHSMGTGVALRFAADRPETDRVVLAAPFTRISDMVRRLVGPLASLLLKGDLDNMARLRALSRRTAPPSVTVVHGDRDPIVPVAMSRTLAAAFPGFVKLTVVPGGDHGTVLVGMGALLK